MEGSQHVDNARSRNGNYGTSILYRITLPHFSVSAAMNALKSAGESGIGVLPRSARRAFTFGSTRAALISLLSLAMIAAGVLLGTPTPDQSIAS
jgi:uncharacterized oligopeptide transporter (OPT) family protein